MDQMLAAGLPQVVTLGGTALPLAGRARVYVCGITPYDVTHLGHAATFVWVDTLARVLHADGTEVIVCRRSLAGVVGETQIAAPGVDVDGRPCSPGRTLAEAFTGVTPFARARLNVGVVRAAGAKMAKSAGNLILVSDLLKVYPAAAIRLLILDRPWDQDWDYNQGQPGRGGGTAGATAGRGWAP